jgi:hypothetical protein
MDRFAPELKDRPQRVACGLKLLMRQAESALERFEDRCMA